MQVYYTTNFYWRDEENFPHYDLFRQISFSPVPTGTNSFFNSLDWTNSNNAQTVISKSIDRYDNYLFKVVSNNTTRYYFIESILKELPNGYVVNMQLDMWSTYMMNANNWNRLVNKKFNMIRSPFFHKDTLSITDPEINSIISNIEDRAWFKSSIPSQDINFLPDETVGNIYAKSSMYAIFHVNPADISYNSNVSTNQYFGQVKGSNINVGPGNLAILCPILKKPSYICVPLFGDSDSRLTAKESIARPIQIKMDNVSGTPIKVNMYTANSLRGISKLINKAWWQPKFIGFYEGPPFSSFNYEDIWLSFLEPRNNMPISSDGNSYIPIQLGEYNNATSYLYVSYFINQIEGTGLKELNWGISNVNSGRYTNNLISDLNYTPLLKYLDARINGGKCNASILYYHSTMNNLNGNVLPKSWVTFNNKFFQYTKNPTIPTDKTYASTIEYPMMSPYSSSGYSAFINANQNTLDTAASNKVISGVAGVAGSLIPAATGMNYLTQAVPKMRGIGKIIGRDLAVNQINKTGFGGANSLLDTIAGIRSINATKKDAYNSAKPDIKASDEGMEYSQENFTTPYGNDKSAIGGVFLSVKNISQEVWDSLRYLMYLKNYYCYQYKKIGDTWTTRDCGFFEFVDDNIYMKLTQIILTQSTTPIITDETLSWFMTKFSEGIRIWKVTPNF